MATAVLDRTWKQDPPVAPKPRHLRRNAWLGAVAIVVVTLIAGIAFLATRPSSLKSSALPAAAVGTHPTSPSVPANTAPVGSTNPTTSAPSITTPPPTQSPTALVSTDLPVVACPTSYGVPPNSTAPLPSSKSVSVPADLTNQLSVYADEQGIIELLGPRGWVCNASIAVDGSSQIQVYPDGETLPTGPLPSSSTAQAIVASQTSACLGCREEQACPLFTTAAADYQNDYQMPCPTTKPSEESVEVISGSVVGFYDPAGVAGDGNPSGGTYPANGVMTYYSGNDNGSWMDTCTLPNNEQALCTTVLNNFVAAYGAN